jgi:1-acyl-sn-glycerol-3-phosphate acyltransferase
MLRLPFIVCAILFMTAALMPVQVLSLVFNWPLRRSIPVLYHRMVCALVGVRVHVVGAPPASRPLLILANHSSWLDIAVITSVLSVVFVAKREVARWPFFGWLAKLQRSVFVDRERRHRTGKATSEIAERLLEGDAVVLFAEGTSSDGNRVLPFRTALLGAAQELLATGEADHALVQPMSIAYVGLQGLPISRDQRCGVSWYGGIDLMPHLLNLVRGGAVDVVVTFGEAMTYDRATDRKRLAKTMEDVVRRLTVTALRTGLWSDRTDAAPGGTPQLARGG